MPSRGSDSRSRAETGYGKDTRREPGDRAPWLERPAQRGPVVPDSVSADQLDPVARAQLTSLPNDLADSIARYLVAAGVAEDPETAYAYTRAAHRLAARVGIVREAVGIAAYQTGRWAEALAELRAARRLTGSDDYLPLMADSERALGRLDRALALLREADLTKLERATQIELLIVESGIRRDQGLADAAVVVLQVPELKGTKLRPWSARLLYAYADALLAAEREGEARYAFIRAAAADPEGQTDAAERLNELDGIDLEDLEDDDEDLHDEEVDDEGNDLDVDDQVNVDADVDVIVEVDNVDETAASDLEVLTSPDPDNEPGADA